MKWLKEKLSSINYGTTTSPYPSAEAGLELDKRERIMDNSYAFELLELSAFLVDANREFTQALKDKKPHVELAEMFERIKDIHNQLSLLKNDKP